MATDQLNIPENPSKNFYEYFRFKLGRDTPSDVRNSLLVVTTLIVAVTFQAALNPPGGVWQDDKYSPATCTAVRSDSNCTLIRHAGTSILYYRDRRAYFIFVALNTMAFSSATTTIYCLVRGSPLQKEVLFSIYSTAGAFCASVVAVHPPNTIKGEVFFIALLPPYISLLIYEGIKGKK